MLQYQFMRKPSNLTLLDEVIVEVEDFLANTQKKEEVLYYQELKQFLSLIKEDTIFDYDIYIKNVNEFRGLNLKLDRILYEFTVVNTGNKSLQKFLKVAQSTKSITAPSRRSRKPTNCPKFGAVTLLNTAL